jgi:hypothetical protein
MPATQGVIGLNTQIKIGDGASPEVFTLIPEAKDISGPESTQEFADFTHQQSPSGFRERKPTVKSSGTVTFNMNRVYGDTQQDALLAASNANPATLTNFQLLYPDGDLIDFAAYVSTRWSAPMMNPLSIDVTLTLEGAFTIT